MLRRTRFFLLGFASATVLAPFVVGGSLVIVSDEEWNDFKRKFDTLRSTI